ncbi:MAG: methyltransferase domain-containing protein [Acidimicrobiales bacterium]
MDDQPDVPAGPDPHDEFPVGFFRRGDEADDAEFYAADRFVAHIDDRAIEAVGRLYRRLGIDGGGSARRVLDFMASWISHFLITPPELVVLGMNERELRANRQASSYVVHDLNADAKLPFPDGHFDAATCCVSIDYLVRPIDVLREVSRVVAPGGPVVCTFSNRCFPTKVIRGWLAISEAQRCHAVGQYFRLAGGYTEPQAMLCTPPGDGGDPLYAVWASVLGGPTADDGADAGDVTPS